MARLIGFLGNRPDLGARALALDSAAFDVQRPSDGSLSWGLGFYQGGEILLKRRPFEDRPRVNFAELVSEVKADALVGHIRTATVGALRTENTHPFRYRQWLFAMTGTVSKFDAVRGRLRESLPQFLARDVRGDTDAELVFYLFLSFLHDAGKLDRSDVEAELVRSATRSTLSLVDRLCAEEGEGPSTLNTIIACGDYLVAARAGGEMAHTTIAGRAAIDRLFGNDGPTRLKLPQASSFHLSMVAADFDEGRTPPGWSRVPDRHTLTLTRADEGKLEAL